MSKHRLLTQDEFSTFELDQTLVNHIELYRKTSNLKKEEMNILDWGCGRGNSTLKLKELGYNTYEVDIDIEPIQNGINLFKEKGYDSSTLQVLSEKGITDFPNNYFHFTFADQVFEHIKNLEETAIELLRITAVGGVGYHVYPAHRHINEAHLHMPFVHWLPKNILRKYLIIAQLYLNRDPEWEELKNLSLKHKANEYYKYSKSKTFYRKPSYVKSIFEKNGFRVDYKKSENTNLVGNKFLLRLVDFKLTKPVFNYIVYTFKTTKLLIRKL